MSNCSLCVIPYKTEMAKNQEHLRKKRKRKRKLLVRTPGNEALNQSFLKVKLVMTHQLSSQRRVLPQTTRETM